MTTAQPDDAGPNPKPDRHTNSTAHQDALESRPASTPTGTEEPLWVLVSIVLGLAALSGSIVVLVLVAIAGLFVHLVHVTGGEAKPGRNRFDGPTSRPDGWF
ncbi:hypothetical protein ACQPWY_23945 [Pseudonocardia xinjiangensis]|uniref:hypothetical protein n=1 Tax=Pseudonocardia xinjiangensis TaxID=75289 RepID=UPI003D922D6B